MLSHLRGIAVASDALLSFGGLGRVPTQDEVLTAINAADSLKARAREVAALIEAAAVAWIQEHGEIVCGDVRYYAGTAASVKCLSPAGAARAILDASGGDIEALLQSLNSDPFKVAPARSILGDAYAAHFERTTKLDLKTGRPLRRLHKHDPRFVPRSAAGTGDSDA